MASLIPILLAFGLSAYISLMLKAPLPSPAFRPAADINPSFFPILGKHEGLLAKNERLRDAIKLFKGRINGSESVAIAEDGSLFLPDKYGFIHRATLTAGAALTPQLDSQPWAFLGGGRPLGAEFDKEGNLIVCLPPVGLVMVEAATRRVTVLTSKVDSQDPSLTRAARISYPNDLAIDEVSGDIFFSDATEIPPAPGSDGVYDTMAAFMLAAFQGSPSGRILKYSPSKGTTTIVADRLWFPNGVALSRDRSFLVVAETCSQRLRRITIAGPQAGTVETMTDGLTGFPDGVSSAPGGGFWVSLINPSQDALKYVLPYKAARAVAAKIYVATRPTPAASGQLLKVSESGHPTAFFQDSKGTVVSGISSATQRRDRVYFGHLGENYISYLRVGDELKA